MNLLDQESEVHTRVINNYIVRDGIMNALGISGDTKFIHEDEYINGIVADFSIIANNKIKAIMECKGGHIGVTDYVRGIGQVFQYEYFAEKNILHKSIPYDENFNSVYFFPDSVIRNNTFNIAKFKYPQSLIILEINENNNAVRLISKKELEELDSAYESNLVTISQYYFRDNRVFEYYILLKYLLYLEQRGLSNFDRKELENRFLKKIGTINNGNWRNAFITVSNLGLINNKNMLTEAGKTLAIKSYEDFAVEIYNSYIKVYFEEIFNAFKRSGSCSQSNQELVEILRKHYRDRDILYLTQSNGRYISSWLNIMRDDYGCIKFESRSSNRKIMYNPNELNEAAFKLKIFENSIAYQYINKYTELIQRGEF